MTNYQTGSKYQEIIMLLVDLKTICSFVACSMTE